MWDMQCCVCEILIKWWIWYKLTLVCSLELLESLVPHDDGKRRKQRDSTTLPAYRSERKKTEPMKCLAYVSHVSDVQYVSRTQLDISNIYTSKFCTKPRLIWMTEKGQQKRREWTWVCVCFVLCVWVCDRVIGAQQKWYSSVTRKKIVCVVAVYALCG